MIIAAGARGRHDRKEIAQQRDATLRIQACRAGCVDRRLANARREAVVVIQRDARRRLARNKAHTIRGGVLTVQAFVRRLKALKQRKVLKTKREELERREQKLAQLRRRFIPQRRRIDGKLDGPGARLPIEMTAVGAAATWSDEDEHDVIELFSVPQQQFPMSTLSQFAEPPCPHKVGLRKHASETYLERHKKADSKLRGIPPRGAGSGLDEPRSSKALPHAKPRWANSVRPNETSKHSPDRDEVPAVVHGARRRVGFQPDEDHSMVPPPEPPERQPNDEDRHASRYGVASDADATLDGHEATGSRRAKRYETLNSHSKSHHGRLDFEFDGPPRLGVTPREPGPNVTISVTHAASLMQRSVSLPPIRMKMRTQAQVPKGGKAAAARTKESKTGSGANAQ